MDNGRIFSWNISPVCLAVGVMEGLRCVREQDALPDWRIPVFWAASAIAVILLSGIFYRLLDVSASKSDGHLLRVMSAFGNALVIAACLFVLATCMNLARFSECAPFWLAAATGAAAVVFCIIVHGKIAGPLSFLLERFLDSDIILAFAVTVTAALALFASPVPLSPCLLLLCGIYGCRLAKGWDMEGLKFSSTVFNSLVLFPVLGFLAAYSASMIADPLMTVNDATVILALSVLCALLLVLLIAALVSLRKTRNRATRRLGEQEDELTFHHRRVSEMEVEIMKMENENLQALLDMRRKETIGAAEKISEQKEFIDSIYAMVLEAEGCQDIERKSELLHQIKAQLNLRRNFSGEQDHIFAQAEQLHKDFSARLSVDYPQLTAQERKLATLLRLDFSTKYIASLLNISPKSVEIERHRLRTKLGLERKVKLTDYLKHI